VRILINKNTKDALLECNPVYERIITAPINTKFRKMTVVQCYAPTENADLEEKEALYSHLHRTLLDIHRSDIILFMGNFNAQVGNDNQDTEHVIGKHGLPPRNMNGDLIELCGRHGLNYQRYHISP
jgi:exonuclease III